MSSIRDRMALQTANLRKTSSISDEEMDATKHVVEKPKTGPGMAGALAAAQLKIQELEASGGQATIPVAEVVPNPWQPRRVFVEAELSDLAESIREKGLVQPVAVRRVESGYQLVAGERRLRAHKILGMEQIKAVIVECSDEDMVVLALVENIGRANLTDYEIAISLRRAEAEFPNRKRLAESLGMSRTGLYQFLAFDKLPDFIKEQLDLQPALLGCNAAEEVVSAIKKHGAAGLAAAKDLWSDVVKGEILQGRYAAAIVAQATRQGSRAEARERSIAKFFSGKEQAGSITKDVNSFTVKIKTGSLSEAQETRIRQLIRELYREEPSAQQ
ncbi:chromosome partitioning protein ParB [Paraburkholderia steynii]|uniref:Chromosome partitioning protein ParB n=1 Tax=Paraburkholderia steynii TaxID=1245441 RepID=A0A4R0X0Z3_9BURK|nr:chromosome partitioning protein ParB [Paraburkholderia steynii]